LTGKENCTGYWQEKLFLIEKGFGTVKEAI
jgi:hypothetical protein